MELKKVRVADIKPYPNNPRRNDEAVAAVAESIRQCGYCAPIVVDENMVILAGHTRHRALEQLGWVDCEVVVKDGLTDEMKRKYRLLDNKTAEISGWDFERLEEELEGLDFDGFDFGFTTNSFLDAMGDSLTGEGSLDSNMFSMTLTFDKKYEAPIKDYIAENGKDRFCDLIIREAGEVA